MFDCQPIVGQLMSPIRVTSPMTVSVHSHHLHHQLLVLAIYFEAMGSFGYI